jgi:hypothetical protein
MSTPMYDMPEHFPLPLNDQGQGPETDDNAVYTFGCWCGKSDCLLFQVSGDAYRLAKDALGHARVDDAGRVVSLMIQFGWKPTFEE